MFFAQIKNSLGLLPLMFHGADLIPYHHAPGSSTIL
jgi:hypothetical protein